jgi:hypothetical protein
MSDAWTTRQDPDYLAQFGVDEVHTVFFEPPGWPGKGPAVSLGIPECELQLVFLDKDGEPVAMVNRPTKNLNVKSWLRSACEQANKYNAVLMLQCDTREQAEIGARRVAKLLPQYRRIALERMYEPSSRRKEGLS